MTTQPSPAPSGVSRPGRSVAFFVLAAGFVAALLPVFHWSLGAAATAMTYLIGTAALITVGIIAVYLSGRTAEGTVEAEGAGQ
ncbi:hypothetical protein [Citricoccus sp.]|uniref:hypothetical protein n=1 Tax=Citricoccus sp. TaxID=1978372 RepID=UPI002622C873|nr:hypothetical protein [Citricoccus sp.]HRO94616.1 hypothetical protein [Citricoccus sp.]